MTTKNLESTYKVAVVGGGLAGCAVARQLLMEKNSQIEVTLFDWGRAVGGRSSHRFRPEASSNGDSTSTLQLHFDHGAQFVHVNDPELLQLIQPALVPWPPDLSRLGWLNSTTGQFTSSSTSDTLSTASTKIKGHGFFGASDPLLNPHRFVGKGGMNAIANELLVHGTSHRRLQIKEAVRVAECKFAKGKWKLSGDGSGHEQATAKNLKNSQQSDLGEFDALVITDHMAIAMPSWHPCHIKGLDTVVPELVTTLREALEWDDHSRRFRRVQSLFTCMVALPKGLELSFDAVTIQGSNVLQWACCQTCRPHAETNDDNYDELERWVLVSTPEFATKCLGQEGMSRVSMGDKEEKSKHNVEYIPQTDDYLREDPAIIMWGAFATLISKESNNAATATVPMPVFLKCQRWGAAYTTGVKEVFELEAVLQKYEQSHAIAVCGDFVNQISTNAGMIDPFSIQKAALSGIHAAKKIEAISRWKSKTGT